MRELSNLESIYYAGQDADMFSDEYRLEYDLRIMYRDTQRRRDAWDKNVEDGQYSRTLSRCQKGIKIDYSINPSNLLSRLGHVDNRINPEMFNPNSKGIQELLVKMYKHDNSLRSLLRVAKESRHILRPLTNFETLYLAFTGCSIDVNVTPIGDIINHNQSEPHGVLRFSYEWGGRGKCVDIGCLDSFGLGYPSFFPVAVNPNHINRYNELTEDLYQLRMDVNRDMNW